VTYRSGPLQRIRDVEIGDGSIIGDFVNLYECRIGADATIGAFVEIGKNASIGERCTIGSHAYICPGVTIEDEVFVGERVSFINDRYPRAINSSGSLSTEADWTVQPTTVKRGASIGAGAVILCNVTIGAQAQIKAGAVVTRDVPEGATVAGNPARQVHP